MTSSPDRTFDYVSDVGNLPRYMDSMTSAELTGPEEVHVTAQVPDQGTEEGEAWFRTDPATRRVEWGSEGHRTTRAGSRSTRSRAPVGG